MDKLRLNRPIVAAVHDLAMAAASFVLSLYLRLGDGMMAQASDFILEGTVLFTAACGFVFWWLRFYRALWRYASLTDLWALTRGVTLAILVFLPLLFFTNRLEMFPRSALVINWFVLLALLGGPRFLYRLIRDGGLSPSAELAEDKRIPVLLVGAADQADAFIREMTRRASSADYRVVGVVDDRREMTGARLRSVEVLGRLDEIPKIVDKLKQDGRKPQRLILADRFDGETVRRLLDTAEKLGLTVARLPRLTEFQSGVGGQIEVRPVAVEDLLGRPQMVLDRDSMRQLIEGRRLMVTGAGGTIGSELVRQIAAMNPAHVTLFDNGEFNLYRIDSELAERYPELSRGSILGDIRDRRRIDTALTRERPEVVFHAAAFKHVPMVEANPNEGVLTNVAGTRNLADACRAADVREMVLISTDKAVNPSSVMGATKRVAELYCQALGATMSQGGTRFITVRFGNVLGSTGSVVPLFRSQLAEGGPITVTHPDMTRYFMTVREAVELVLQASAIGGGDKGRGGEIFVLEMGEPVRIQDLARQMIRLAGFRPDHDVRIVFSGIRAGEKMHEELFYESESLVPTGREGIMLARSQPADLKTLLSRINELATAAQGRRASETLTLLGQIVPDYRPVAPSRPGQASAGD